MFFCFVSQIKMNTEKMSLFLLLLVSSLSVISSTVVVLKNPPTDEFVSDLEVYLLEFSKIN